MQHFLEQFEVFKRYKNVGINQGNTVINNVKQTNGQKIQL